MLRVRFQGIAAALLIPVLMLLGGCEPHPEEVAAVQQTIVRDVANAGNVGPREALPLAEFANDEFAAANPSITWASVAPPKDDAENTTLIFVNAAVTGGESDFPAVTLRFTYDPATQQVAYRDTLMGKKALTDKNGRTVLLASAYEALKARVDAAKAKADAKAKAKAKKDKAKKAKDKVAHVPKNDAEIDRS